MNKKEAIKILSSLLEKTCIKCYSPDQEEVLVRVNQKEYDAIDYAINNMKAKK